MRMLSRQFFWRLGRKMYMWARNEEPNDMTQNGELRLQRLIADSTPHGSPLIAFDVGARIGDWSQSLIRRSGRRSGGLEIHAFEPVPDSRQVILESLAAAIGAGGLGEFIFRGLAMVDDRVILAGAVPAALLALLADFLLGRLERHLGTMPARS